jgi:hypothetical protein
MWTFVSGTDIVNDPGKYSDPKTPDPSAYPPARMSSVCWKDMLEIFGYMVEQLIQKVCL